MQSLVRDPRRSTHLNHYRLYEEVCRRWASHFFGTAAIDSRVYLSQEEVSSPAAACSAVLQRPTLYVANRGVTMKLRFGGKAVPT